MMVTRNPRVIWRVDPKPVGPYRTFDSRSWPMAQLGVKGEEPIARVIPVGEAISYDKRVAETTELKIRVTDHRKTLWVWCSLRDTVLGMTAAKLVVQEFYDEHDDWLPLSKELIKLFKEIKTLGGQEYHTDRLARLSPLQVRGMIEIGPARGPQNKWHRVKAQIKDEA